MIKSLLGETPRHDHYGYVASIQICPVEEPNSLQYSTWSKMIILRIAEVSGDVRERVDVTEWMRFGDTLAIFADADDSVARAVFNRETALYHDIDSGQLFVVGQKVRLFQKEHPDVPILDYRNGSQ